MRDPMRGDRPWEVMAQRFGGAATPGSVNPFQMAGGAGPPQQNGPDLLSLLRLAQGNAQQAPGGQYTPQQLELARMTGLPPEAFPAQGLGGCCG